MLFPPKTKKGLSAWTNFFLGLITVLSVFIFIGLNFIEDSNYLVAFCLIVFLLSVVAIFGVVYLMRYNLEGERVKHHHFDEEKLIGLQQELQKAKETSQSKSTYLANVSHEIRIPLSTILGMIKMLKNTDLNLNQQAQLEIAEYSSEHLLQLVNMILDNSHSEDNELIMNNVAIDIEADLSKLFKVFEYQAWEKGLEFTYKFVSDKKQNFLLLGDLKKIQQVLVNLVNNAIKFTDAGSIEITIDNTITHDDFQVVTFYVRDTGTGMSNSEIAHAFNALQERDAHALKEYRSSGIGLSVTNKLVDFMGGELKIESKKNEGSTLYFSLQLKKTLNLKVEYPKDKPLLLNKYDFRFNVLVAEDNKMNQKVIKFLLEREGADCTFVTNGLDAVNLYEIIDFDMIFMDIYMPKMDGYAATKAIKASDKYIKNKIPIIAVSASAFDEDIENAKEAGVDEFLAKPIDNEKLKVLLSKYALKKENVS
ncbi:hypothetical protein MHTCC0001_24550 [Flavobacteriaceae bacterium MHTCC 0001]